MGKLNKLGAVLVVPAMALSLEAVPAIDLIATNAQAKELIFNSYAPRRTALYRIWFDDFAKRIQAATNGAVTVNIPGATLAPPARQLQIVKQGIADVASVPSFSQRKSWKLMRIAELPFNAPSATAATVALMRTHKKFFEPANEFKDVRLLSLGALKGRQYITAKHPVNRLNDLKGLKLWATAGPLSVAAKVTGATVVPAPFPKLFEFASKGTIDGMVTTMGSAFAAGVGNFSKYMLRVPGGVGSISFALVMNRKSWDSLTATEKKGVEEAAAGLPIRFGKATDGFEGFAAKKLKISVVDASPAVATALQKRLAGLTENWLKAAAAAGIGDPQEALSFYRGEVKKLSAR